MKAVKRIWGKLLTCIVAGSTSIFIAACYGMPMGYGMIGFWTVRVRNADGKPIPGLSVTFIEEAQGSSIIDTVATGFTDSTGVFQSPLHTCRSTQTLRHSALIRDIDGEENGALRDMVVLRTDRDTTDVVMLP